jgi:hypothetical protein
MTTPFRMCSSVAQRAGVSWSSFARATSKSELPFEHGVFARLWYTRWVAPTHVGRHHALSRSVKFFVRHLRLAKAIIPRPTVDNDASALFLRVWQERIDTQQRLPAAIQLLTALETAVLSKCTARLHPAMFGRLGFIRQDKPPGPSNRRAWFSHLLPW